MNSSGALRMSKSRVLNRKVKIEVTNKDVIFNSLLYDCS